MKQVKKQLRRAFQASKVRHERDIIAERTKQPDDRKRTPQKKRHAKKGKLMPTKRRRRHESESDAPSGSKKDPEEVVEIPDSDE